MRPRISLLAFACLTLTGCYGSFETVTLQTTTAGAALPGAQCSLYNQKGLWTVTTPDDISVHLGSEPLGITCMKDGYQTVRTDAPSSAHIAAIIVAPTWSTVNGSAWNYPKVITVPMQPLPATPVAVNPGAPTVPQS